MITQIQTRLAMSAKNRKRGFTLTEIAIVLGIIGLILGAIWGAASSVYSNKKLSDAEQGITASAQAVRSLFATSNSTGAASAGAVITTPGMLPLGWTNTSGGYGNPWATTTNASSFSYVTADSGALTKFAIEVDGITGAGCAGLLNYFSSAASNANGGQVTGLTASKVTTTAPTLGTSSNASAAPVTYAVGSSCVNTTPTTANTLGNNNVSIWFDMSKM